MLSEAYLQAHSQRVLHRLLFGEPTCRAQANLETDFKDDLGVADPAPAP